MSITTSLPKKYLPPRQQSISSSHGLDDKGGGEEGHEGEENEDYRGEKVASIFEGSWQCEGSSAHYQVENVDKTCKKKVYQVQVNQKTLNL